MDNTIWHIGLHRSITFVLSIKPEEAFVERCTALCLSLRMKQDVGT